LKFLSVCRFSIHNAERRYGISFFERKMMATEADIRSGSRLGKVLVEVSAFCNKAEAVIQSAAAINRRHLKL
jgi:hypothetical protein